MIASRWVRHGRVVVGDSGFRLGGLAVVVRGSCWPLDKGRCESGCLSAEQHLVVRCGQGDRFAGEFMQLHGALGGLVIVYWPA